MEIGIFGATAKNVCFLKGIIYNGGYLKFRHLIQNPSAFGTSPLRGGFSDGSPERELSLKVTEGFAPGVRKAFREYFIIV